jgi:hypothetical protein
MLDTPLVLVCPLKAHLFGLWGVARDPPEPTRIGLSSRHRVPEIETVVVSARCYTSMYFMACPAENLIIPTFT